MRRFSGQTRWTTLGVGLPNERTPVKYTVVIPAFNSASVVGETIDRTTTFLRALGESYEVIVVNDGSRDETWDVLRRCALNQPGLVAIDLLRNYGQHTAVLCGLRASNGEYTITLDDDLQNPPEEIRHLIDKADEGHDLVIGRFRRKHHAWYRRVGTWIIGGVNRRIFRKPKGLILTNFRLIRRDVVDRICSYDTNFPYIPGLALMFARSPANVLVEHRARESGTSQYSSLTIFQLVLRILFSYSTYPLRTVSLVGGAAAAASFVLGTAYLAWALLVGTTVPGWATVVVLLSFFNGVAMLSLAMLGEYTVRLLNQTSGHACYYIRETVRRDEVAREPKAR